MARNFSEILNRIGTGEEIEIVRNGVSVAQMRPSPPGRSISAEHWRELIESAPPVDEDFERDLEDVRRAIGAPDSTWPS